MADGVPPARIVRDDMSKGSAEQFEEQLAAFTRQNHHRWGIALGVAALMLLAGAVALGLAVIFGDFAPDYWHSASKMEVQRVRLGMYAAAAFVGALGIAGWAVKTWRNREPEPVQPVTVAADFTAPKMASDDTASSSK